MALPLFSVIVPTYHRNESLAKCLDRLAPAIQTLPAEQYEVIVTDDGLESTAKSIIRQHYPWASWVAGAHKNPAANRNNGAKYAQGEWLAFTDDDCLPDPQWLESYAKAIVEQPDHLVFEGRTYVDRPRQSLAETAPINESGGYLWSCNFIIQRKLFGELGGFNEKFSDWEDIELRTRLKNNRHEFMFIPDAAVCHPWRLKNGWKDAWKSPGETQKAILTFLSLYPDELKQKNSLFFIKSFVRSLINSTIPGILKYRAKGIKAELFLLSFFLYTAILIFLKFNLRLNLFQNER